MDNQKKKKKRQTQYGHHLKDETFLALKHPNDVQEVVNILYVKNYLNRKDFFKNLHFTPIRFLNPKGFTGFYQFKAIWG